MDIDDLLSQAQKRRDLPPPRVRARLRKRAGLSRAAVGVVCGVSRQTVKNWEEGTWYPAPEHLDIYLRLLSGLADS